MLLLLVVFGSSTLIGSPAQMPISEPFPLGDIAQAGRTSS
jgi:hypothetical protein